MAHWCQSQEPLRASRIDEKTRWKFIMEASERETIVPYKNPEWEADISDMYRLLWKLTIISQLLHMFGKLDRAARQKSDLTSENIRACLHFARILVLIIKRTRYRQWRKVVAAPLLWGLLSSSRTLVGWRLIWTVPKSVIAQNLILFCFYVT